MCHNIQRVLFSMNFKIVFVISFLMASLSVFAQTEANFPTMHFNGVIKNQLSYAPEANEVRFSVRHARINFRGDIAPLVSYHTQMELSSNGSFHVLDLTAIFRPTNNLALHFGQFYIPLLDPYITSPAQAMFANHAFIQHLVRNRDLGFMASYGFSVGRVPVLIDAGVFNANTINAPTWNSPDSLSVLLRANFGSMTGFRTSIKMYNHPSAARDVHHRFFGVTARYETSNWRVDSEAMWRNDRNNSHLNMFTTYIQAAYTHPIQHNRFFHAVVPAVRWDTLTQNDPDSNGIDMHRITTGIGFTLTNAPWTRTSILRFDYEWFMINNRIDQFFEAQNADSNRFTVGLVLNF